MKSKRQTIAKTPEAVARLLAFSNAVTAANPTLSEYLNHLLEEKGLRAPEVYHRAEIDRQVFNRLVQYGRPVRAKKRTLLQIAVGLCASERETAALLATCGYTFEYASAEDQAFLFCLNNGYFDMYCVYEAMELIANRQARPA